MQSARTLLDSSVKKVEKVVKSNQALVKLTGQVMHAGNQLTGRGGAIDEIVVGFLFLGNLFAASSEDILNERGITYILGVTQFGETAKFFENNYIYKIIEIHDECESDLFKHFEDTYGYILECLRDGGKILVHCNQGRSRSASVVLAFLMRIQRWSLEQTLIFLRSKRSCVNPNEGFLKQLKAYEKYLQNLYEWKPSNDEAPFVLTVDDLRMSDKKYSKEEAKTNLKKQLEGNPNSNSVDGPLSNPPSTSILTLDSTLNPNNQQNQYPLYIHPISNPNAIYQNSISSPNITMKDQNSKEVVSPNTANSNIYQPNQNNLNPNLSPSLNRVNPQSPMQAPMQSSIHTSIQSPIQSSIATINTPAMSPFKQQIYEHYFKLANTSKSGYLENSEAQFLALSGLSNDTLSKVWSLASNGSSRLSIYQSYLTFNLIALAQKNLPLDINLALQFDCPLPIFQGITPNNQ